MLDLTLLGCGGGMPIPERFLSSLCISYSGHKILIDCGEGTQVSMKMCRLGFKSIDIICISHVHGDHIVGLPGLLSTIGNSGREEPVTIIGPSGIREAVDGLMVINKYLPYKVNVIENPKDDIEVFNKDLIISFLEAYHTSPCISFSFYLKRKRKFDVNKALKNKVPKLLWNRLQNTEDMNYIEYEEKKYNKDMVMGRERNGIKLSFVTDSRPTSSMVDFIYNSDLFICEGTYGDDSDLDKAIKNKHMTFREAAKLANDADVKELLLTHFSTAMMSPDFYLNNASDEFTNVKIGYDRMKKELNFNDQITL